MIRRLLMSGGVLAALALPCSAQEIDCAAPTNQAEIATCITQSLRQAEADLDVACGLAWSRTVRIDDTLSAPQRGAEAALRNAQRAWIAYRDATCATEGFEHRGEAIEPMVVSLCIDRLTRTRSDGLRALAEAD